MFTICKRRPIVVPFLLLFLAIANIGGCNDNSNSNAIQKVINIDPDDDSCMPFNQ